jgi:hypothetical protein
MGGGLNMRKSDRALLAGLPELSDEEKHQRTLAALSDVDAGRTIPYEVLEAWALSLLEPNHHPKKTK